MIKITTHKVFKDATTQAIWLTNHIRFHYCDMPASHLTHLTLHGGKYNHNCAADIWYMSKRIYLYNIKILDKIKEFAKVFGYTNIEIYESE